MVRRNKDRVSWLYFKNTKPISCAVPRLADILLDRNGWTRIKSDHKLHFIIYDQNGKPAINHSRITLLNPNIMDFGWR